MCVVLFTAATTDGIYAEHSNEVLREAPSTVATTFLRYECSKYFILAANSILTVAWSTQGCSARVVLLLNAKFEGSDMPCPCSTKKKSQLNQTRQVRIRHEKHIGKDNESAFDTRMSSRLHGWMTTYAVYTDSSAIVVVELFK